MKKTMLHQEAAAFEEERELPLRDILFFAGSLAALMASKTEAGSFACHFAILAAFILAFMTEEDAHDQTIDLRHLSLLGAVLLVLSVFQSRAYDFARGLLCGTLFFASFRLLLSVWMTCRAGDGEAFSGKDEVGEEPEPEPMGYVPIFMLVFALYLGFGTDWASVVFQKAAMAAAIADETVAYFSWILAIAIAFYLLLTSWEVFRIYRRKPIIYAFGGGDVLFLGLFAGHLGGGTLMALFFLSLIAQALIMGIRSVLKINSFHIKNAQRENKNRGREES